MVLSPLVLKNYFITNVAVKAIVPTFPNPEEALKAIAGSGANITTKVETAKNNENGRDWRVVLQLSCRPTEDKFCLYLVDLELVGFFDVHQSIEESKVEELVICNGPAVLLGAARELVFLITSRGPVAPFMLPSATFVDLRPAGKMQERKCSEKADSIA